MICGLIFKSSWGLIIFLLNSYILEWIIIKTAESWRMLMTKDNFEVFIWTYSNQEVAKTLKISKYGSCVKLLLIGHLDSVRTQCKIIKVWAIQRHKVIFPSVSILNMFPNKTGLSNLLHWMIYLWLKHSQQQIKGIVTAINLKDINHYILLEGDIHKCQQHEM